MDVERHLLELKEVLCFSVQCMGIYIFEGFNTVKFQNSFTDLPPARTLHTICNLL